MIEKQKEKNWTALLSHGSSLFRLLDTKHISSKVILCVFLLLTFLFASTGDTAFLYAQF